MGKPAAKPTGDKPEDKKDALADDDEDEMDEAEDDLTDEDDEDEDEDDEGVSELLTQVTTMVDSMLGSIVRNVQALNLDNLICSKISTLIADLDFEKPLPDNKKTAIDTLVKLRTTLFGQGIPMFPSNIMNSAMKGLDDKE
jgi:hypothetical protein